VVSRMGGVRRGIGLLAVAAALTLVVRADEITVLFTNDLHARVGRMDAIGQAIEDVREDVEHVLLVDAGDAWHDFRVPVLACWGAGETVRWMNSVGYDAMAIGNHEFAIGPRQLAEAADERSFPLLSANTVALGEMNKPFEESARLTVGPWDVLLIGLTTAEFFPAGVFPWMRMEDAGVALARSVPEEDRDNPELLIIVLAHFGVAEAIRVARSAPWVDLIVTGHTHTPTDAPVVAGRTLIVQASPFGQGLGRIDLTVDDQGNVADWRLESIPVEGPALGEFAGEGLRRLAGMLVLSAAAFWFWLSGV